MAKVARAKAAKAARAKVSAQARAKGSKRAKPVNVASSPLLRELAAAVAAAPDDPELQKIYADALLDEGGEHGVRGELVQLSLSKAAAKARTDELLASFEQSLKNRGITGLAHAGGFVRSWTCSSDDFASFAAEVFGDEPLLREVVIALAHEDAHLQIATLAATPELARVRRLTILGHQKRTGRPGTKGLVQLLASPHWPKLEALALPLCAIGDAGAKALATSGSIAELRELDLTENDLTSKGVIALAESPHLARLARLGLVGNKPALRGIAAIARSAHIAKLEYIDTSRTWLSKLEVRPIKKRWPDIEHVHN